MRELRALTRYRKTLGQERAAESNRLQKVLETANIKLASVATDVLGASGRAMLAALLAGERDPAAVADLAQGKLRAKRSDLQRAVVGRIKPYHRVLIERILAHIDFLEQSIAQVQEEIEHCLPPFEEAVALLDGIPGVGRTAAAAIVAEIGVDMSRFPTHAHLASWAGVCPGNKQSGGKRLSGKTTKGNPWLRAVLGEVAWAIARSPGTYLHAHYHRLARRRGTNKAIVAVAHSVLVTAYHLLQDKCPYPLYGSRRRLLRYPRHGPHPAPSCPPSRTTWLFRCADPTAGGLMRP